MFYFIIFIIALYIAYNSKQSFTIVKDCFFDVENNKIHAFLYDNSYYYGEYALSIYDGSCLLNGMGKIIYKNNYTFVGTFWYNMKHGEGRLYHNKNSIFKYISHNYTYDNISTNGIIVYKDDKYFIGKYNNLTKLHDGTMYYPNNTNCTGSYKFHEYVNYSFVEIEN
jgi:hypothetical protein